MQSDSTASKALQVIDLFQKYQFREISSKGLEKILKEFPYRNTFLSLLDSIFRKRIPTYYDYNPSHVYYGSSNPILDNLTVCNNSLSADKRMKRIIKLLSLSKPKKDCFQDCVAELSAPLHFQEAKFYADLFDGCKFGFSFDFVNKLLEFYSKSLIPYAKELVSWVAIKKVKLGWNGISFPVFVEPLYHGFLFKLVSKCGKITVFSSYNKEVTGCFPDLQRLQSILPEKTSIIDFVLSSNSSLYFSTDAHQAIDNCIYRNLPITEKLCAITLLDFYLEKDEKDLCFRKKRIGKLLKKLNKLHLTPFVLGDKSSLARDEDELKTKVLSSSKRITSGSLVREAASKIAKAKWFKIMSPHSPEVVKLVDYKYSYVPCFRLDYIVGETEDSKQVILSPLDQPVHLVRNITNFMGRYVKILWKEEGGEKGGFKPVIFSILPEASKF